jgi:hypothetical protein
MSKATAKKITSPAKATPIEIDTALADLYIDRARLLGGLTATVAHLHTIDGQRARYISRTVKSWPSTDADTIASVRAKLATGKGMMAYEVRSAQDTIDRYDEYRAAIEANERETARFSAEYDRRPWQRYIGVLGGHIHSDTRCAGGTIRPRTRLQWQPELSGLDVAGAMATLGTQDWLLCSHCFPDAPVQWQAGAEKKPARCEGSGKPGKPETDVQIGMRYYAVCTGCDERQLLTSGHVIRAHKLVTS